MRKTLVVLAAVTVLTSTVTSAAAATTYPPPTPGGPVPPSEPPVAGPVNLDQLEVSVRPDGTRDGVEVLFDRTSRTASGEKPAAAAQFVFLFDKSIRFHPERFPTCGRATFETGGPAACPPGSRVGSGIADFHPSGSTEVAVFNTRYPNGLRGVLITLPATGQLLENTFEPVSGPYRGDYRWGSDEILPPSPVPPGERGATTRFRVSFGAVITSDGRTHSFLESDARPGRPLTFGLWSRFVTGQVILPTDRTMVTVGR